MRHAMRYRMTISPIGNPGGGLHVQGNYLRRELVLQAVNWVCGPWGEAGKRRALRDTMHKRMKASKSGRIRLTHDGHVISVSRRRMP